MATSSCPTVVVVLGSACSGGAGALDKDTTFEISIEPADATKKPATHRVVVPRGAAGGPGAASALASALAPRLRGTGVTVASGGTSVMPSGFGASHVGDQLGKLTFECVKSVDMSWDLSKVYGYWWSTKGYAPSSVPMSNPLWYIGGSNVPLIKPTLDPNPPYAPKTASPPLEHWLKDKDRWVMLTVGMQAGGSMAGAGWLFGNLLFPGYFTDRDIAIRARQQIGMLLADALALAGSPIIGVLVGMSGSPGGPARHLHWNLTTDPYGIEPVLAGSDRHGRVVSIERPNAAEPFSLPVAARLPGPPLSPADPALVTPLAEHGIPLHTSLPAPLPSSTAPATFAPPAPKPPSVASED